jgi:predicted component of type VI protein secretion system
MLLDRSLLYEKRTVALAKDRKEQNKTIERRLTSAKTQRQPNALIGRRLAYMPKRISALSQEAQLNNKSGKPDQSSFFFSLHAKTSAIPSSSPEIAIKRSEIVGDSKERADKGGLGGGGGGRVAILILLYL